MPGPIVRVFVSSTFNDFRAERDALTAAYPEVDEFCRGFGATFQPVDLRWGISPDACLDQQAVGICLNELRQCQRLSPRPNFILFLGDRYGWRPLPPRIPADEFDLLSSARPDPAFTRWYTRDDNACPPEYQLNPITDTEEWVKAEADLRERFRVALDALGWAADDPRRRKYEIAVTHQEILAGALEVPKPAHDPRTHVFCYFRATASLPETAPPPHPARDFADYLPDGARDQDARARLVALRKQLAEHLPERHRYEYAARWDGQSAAADLDALRARVVSDLTGVIAAELRGRQAVPLAAREREAHAHFGAAARRGFTGQARPLAVIRDYLNDPDAEGPLAIIGPPGAGKTALAAQAAAVLPEAGHGVIARFLGTTPRSSNLRSLLADLSEQIAEEFPEAGFDRVPGDLAELAAEFRRRLTERPEGKPLLVVLDAVDQLDPADGAHTLHWIPHRLPPHVRLIVTVAAEDRTADCVSAAQQVCDGRVLPLPGLIGGDPSSLLDAWLSAGDLPRTVARDQRAALMARFRRNPLPLYLRLLAEEARGWRSTAGVPDLPVDTPDAVRVLFDRLERDTNHGPVLVRAAIGYLAAARRGLSEPEMLDQLAADPEVMADFVRRSPTEQRKPVDERLRRLPLIVWSRLVDELRPYLTERQVSGGMVLDFYHRQIRTATEARYLTEENHRGVFAALARYFAAQPDFVAPGVPNGRKADELPFLLFAAGQSAALADTLGGEAALPFLEAKVAAGLPRELVEDLLVGAGAAPDDHPRKGQFRLLAEAVRRHAAFLERSPAELFRCLWAECWWYDAPAAAAHYPTPEGGWKAPGPPWEQPGPKLHRLLETWRAGKEQAEPSLRWLRAQRPPHVGLGALGSVTLFGHSDRVTDVTFEEGGSRALTASNDQTVRVWELTTGRELRRFPCRATAVAFTSAGPRAVATRESGEVEVWDVTTGALLFATPPSDAPVHETVLSPDGRFLAVAAFDVVGYAYHHPGATELQFVPVGEMNEVMETALLRDGTRVATVARHGSVRVWDLRRRRGFRQYLLSTHGIEAVAFSPDGNVLAFALSGDAVHVYDLQTNESLGELRADLWRVSQLVIAPNGRELLADTPDGWFIWGLPAQDDAQPGRQELPLGHRRAVVTERGLILAICTSANECSVVNLKTQEVRRFPAPTPGRGTGPFLAADGRWLAAAGDQDHHQVRVWSLEDSVAIARMGDTEQKFAFSRDGSLVVGSASDSDPAIAKDQPRAALRLWDARTGEPLARLEGPGSSVELFQFSSDGRYLAAAAQDDYVVWSVPERRTIARVSRPNWSDPPTAIEFKGDLLWLLAADTDVRLWRAENPGVPWQLLRGHERPVTVFAFAPAGTLAAAGGLDGSVRVWNTSDGSQVARIAAHDGRVTALAFSPDGRRLATGGRDRLVLVWDAEPGRPVARAEGHQDKVIRQRVDSPYVTNEVYRQTPLSSYRGGTINALAFSADGRQVASGSDDETVRVWDAESGEGLAQFAIPVAEDRTIDDYGEVLCVAFTPDGNVAAIAADRWFRAWDWRAGTAQLHYPLLERTWRPTFSPDGGRFCLRAGREILVIDSPPREQSESFEIEFRPKRMFFTNAGSHVVVVWDNGGGIVWDYATKRVVHTFDSQQGEVIGARNDDGAILFASQLSGATAVRVDLSAGGHLPFEALADSLKALALSADGRRFATVADKGHIRLHDAATGRVEWAHQDEDVFGLRFMGDDRLATLDVHHRPLRVWELARRIDRDPTAGESQELTQLAQTRPPGAAVRVWSDTMRIAPSTAGTRIGDGPAGTAGGRYEALLAEGRWLLIRDGELPIPLTAGSTELIAAAPDGRTWAVQTEDGWQLFAVEHTNKASRY